MLNDKIFLSQSKNLAFFFNKIIIILCFPFEFLNEMNSNKDDKGKLTWF